MLRAAILLLLSTATLTGCSGFGVGVRQDTEDRDALTVLLAGKRSGDRFPARGLLDRRWTRLFVFAPGAETQPIEDRIGIPFPFSKERAPEDAEYLVFADEEQVVAAFTFAGPPGVDASCLRAGRGPLLPETELTLSASGSGLTTLTGIGRCG
ncbi:MAG: hypothetical protein H0V81_12865 [Solirubrobacterales bacterium]|nr:hypothetical protein [Solirubrobacterales bacterium]